MVPAPVLRGSFADSLPCDLRELTRWLNLRLPDRERPRCARCENLRRIVATKTALFWGCPEYKTCGAPVRPVDEQRLYAYAKRRLRHQPKDCIRARTS